MRSALKLIFMIRDKDLHRWGRASAVLMVLLGLFLLSAVIYSSRLLERIESSRESSSELDRKLIERVEDERVRAALVAGKAGDDQLIGAMRSMILGVGIGGAILSFYTAALSWRCYELVSSIPEHPEPNKQAEQGGDGDAKPRPC